MCDLPRPFKPMTATRTASFAPTTCDHERGESVQAAAVMKEVWRKLRRVSEVVFISLRLFGFTGMKLRPQWALGNSTGDAASVGLAVVCVLAMPRPINSL